MCDFTDLWGTSHPGCLNILFDNTGAYSNKRGILKRFDTSVTTCAEAMTILGQRLKKRLSASDVIVRSSADTEFDIDLRIGRNTASIVVQPFSSCNYPIAVSVTEGPSTSSANFGDLEQLLNWLVLQLRI